MDSDADESHAEDNPLDNGLDAWNCVQIEAEKMLTDSVRLVGGGCLSTNLADPELPSLFNFLAWLKSQETVDPTIPRMRQYHFSYGPIPAFYDSDVSPA